METLKLIGLLKKFIFVFTIFFACGQFVEICAAPAKKGKRSKKRPKKKGKKKAKKGKAKKGKGSPGKISAAPLAAAAPTPIAIVPTPKISAPMPAAKSTPTPSPTVAQKPIAVEPKVVSTAPAVAITTAVTPPSTEKPVPQAVIATAIPVEPTRLTTKSTAEMEAEKKAAETEALRKAQEETAEKQRAAETEKLQKEEALKRAAEAKSAEEAKAKAKTEKQRIAETQKRREGEVVTETTPRVRPSVSPAPVVETKRTLEPLKITAGESVKAEVEKIAGTLPTARAKETKEKFGIENIVQYLKEKLSTPIKQNASRVFVEPSFSVDQLNKTIKVYCLALGDASKPTIEKILQQKIEKKELNTEEAINFVVSKIKEIFEEEIKQGRSANIDEKIENIVKIAYMIEKLQYLRIISSAEIISINLSRPGQKRAGKDTTYSFPGTIITNVGVKLYDLETLLAFLLPNIDNKLIKDKNLKEFIDEIPIELAKIKEETLRITLFAQCIELSRRIILELYKNYKSESWNKFLSSYNKKIEEIGLENSLKNLGILNPNKPEELKDTIEMLKKDGFENWGKKLDNIAEKTNVINEIYATLGKLTTEQKTGVSDLVHLFVLHEKLQSNLNIIKENKNRSIYEIINLAWIKNDLESEKMTILNISMWLALFNFIEKVLLNDFISFTKIYKNMFKKDLLDRINKLNNNFISGRYNDIYNLLSLYKGDKDPVIRQNILIKVSAQHDNLLAEIAEIIIEILDLMELA